MTTVTEKPSQQGHHVNDGMSPLLSTSLQTARNGELMHRCGSPNLDMSGFTPDVSLVKEENRTLRDKLRQYQNDLQMEQDSVYNLRRKLNNQEKERLETVAKLNAENSNLDGELTKLRAQLERGEALRQNLEYELAKSRKECELEKTSASSRESLITEVNDTMKNKVAELTSQLETLCDELERTKAHAHEEACRLRNTIMEKEETISSYRTEKDANETERDRLEASVTHKENTILTLEDKLQDLEGKEQTKTELLRQQATEMELMREKDDRLRREYERALERVRTLEESIEAERAAHLESKFNSEIVQLRIRDLESALELEKTAKSEVAASSDKLTKQLRELQQVREEERRHGQVTRDKLEKNYQPIVRAEKEYAALNKHLHHELEDKRLVIQKLSGQLDVHQKNFDELKQELNKAKKRQVYLEESYTGTTKEMELLLANFSLDSGSKHATMSATAARKKAVTNAKNKKEGSKTQSLAVLQESLRHLLIDYRRRLDEVSNELGRVKTQNETLTKDCSQHKDILWAKDKALESTQQAMSRTSKELRKCQGDLRDLEALSKRQRKEIDAQQSAVEREKLANRALSEQMNKVSTKWKIGEQVSLEFLQTLCQQLQTANKSASHAGATPLPPPRDVKSWTDLALYINDQVAAVLTDFNRARDKINQLEQALRVKDAHLENIQRVYEEQLDKMSALTEGRTHEWLQQKDEMEKHYAQLLDDIQSREKKTQSLADQAWEKVRVTGSVQQGLEAECSQLRSELVELRTQKSSLLAACALLCGAIYPLHVRCAALSAQRNQLQEHMASFSQFKQEVHALVSALSEGARDGTPGDVTGQKSSRGLLRFRKGVLAVIMANRLAHAGKQGCRMFNTQEALPGIYSLIVCNGNVEPQARKFVGLAETSSTQSDQNPTDLLNKSTVSWLMSSNLLATITSTMSDLQCALTKASLDDSSAAPDLTAVGRSCFQKLLYHLPVMFQGVQADLTPGGGRDHGGLIKRLENGLARVVAESQPGNLASSQTVLSGLQQQVLGFTQRLHAAEVERRDLRAEVSTLRQQRDVWSQQAGTLDQAAGELVSLRKQVEQTVAREQFESVCEELNNALRREQKAQELLREQSEQIQELGVRLDIQLSEDSEKEHTLGQAVKGLTEAKMELKRQEQRLRQQNKQLSLLEEERSNLQEHVRDAENALKTASRDRECVTTYVRSVEKALESIKTQLVLTSSLSQKPDFTSLLSSDLIPRQLGKPGHDFTACQRLVAAFVECQRQINAQVTGLQGELRSHKEHIATLKRELSNACKREYEDELEKIKLGEYTFDDLPTKLTYTNNEHAIPAQPAIMLQNPDFTPLIEDVGESFGAKETSTPTKSVDKGPSDSQHSQVRHIAGRSSQHKATDRTT